MFTKKATIILSLLTIISVTALGSDFSITHFEGDTGNTKTQIWLEAEDFDSKTEDFVVDPEVLLASGKAMYFIDPEDDSNTTTLEQWWSEYSVDSTVISDPNVDLSGTWYIWLRGNQPVNSNVESDVIFVKGDPNDGSGESWYDTALAGYDPDDDIIGQIYNTGAAETGNWRWIGQTLGSGGREKEFVLDAEDKIVFRLNEREAGADNVRVDAFCLTDDPNYVPTDVDFNSTPIRDNLVFMMDASHPGNQASTNWKPVIGSPVAEGDFINAPELGVDVDANTYTWFYDFNSAGVGSPSTNDQVYNLGDHEDFEFIYTDWCTIEAWIRMPEDAKKPYGGHQTKGVIIGNNWDDDTGWRFCTRDNGLGTAWAVTFQQRDNETGNTSWEGNFHYHSGAAIDYNDTEWVHVVFVKYPLSYDADMGVLKMNHDFYINGELYTHGERLNPADSPDDMYFTPEVPRLGSPRGDMFYLGETAVVRIYDRLLYADEVYRNYEAGLGSAKTEQCGGVDYDLNGDCVNDFLDFAIFSESWLDNNIIEP
jgi:hypothetical protein